MLSLTKTQLDFIYLCQTWFQFFMLLMLFPRKLSARVSGCRPPCKPLINPCLWRAVALREESLLRTAGMIALYLAI